MNDNQTTMPSNLAKIYNPSDVETKWYDYWLKNGYFHAHVNPDKKPYTIVIPPPNITGVLHMGHVLNNTIQDVLTRWKRMEGYEACWIPGTDHAGIATQHVVERTLRSEGLTMRDLGRKKFLERVWKWKDQYGSTIIKQLKRLGTSCDWNRERFTMDESLSEAVKEVFIRLYKKGFIYRGKYIVNWCPKDHTALSDDEVNRYDAKGNLWYIHYPLEDGETHITVATTRPETMLGDTALAVNPADKRYKDLIGKHVLLPIVNRKLPIIADSFVDPQFGTGVVKVTPAHDQNDFEMGLRHKLEQIIVMDPSGRMNNNVPSQYRGMDRYECRNALVGDLKSLNLLEKIEVHEHSLGKCYRCNTVIEPYLSDQWFVKMKPLAEPALRRVTEGKIKFHPERWKKTYEHWMINIRDWCISRQLWWGHRIPVYYCDNCGNMMVVGTTPYNCDSCGGAELRQDEDVLDTWFSSWLWPFSTLGWPEENEDLKYFYPTDTLVTGPDIIFFWVARMIMAGEEFCGGVPFSDVYFTSIIRDSKGRKMSKSLGNSPEPLDVIDEYGADALRFTTLFLAPLGQDVYFSKEKCEIGRNFANKIWNAARLLIMNRDEVGNRIDSEIYDPDLSDQWITSRLHVVIKSLTDALERFQINEATKIIYDFIWHDFCDWYLEMIKPRLYQSKETEIRNSTLYRALDIFETSLCLLHPFMPFITEELWRHLKPRTEGDSIMITKWPKEDKTFINPDAEFEMRHIQNAITAVRSIRGEMNVPPAKEIELHIKTGEREYADIISRNEPSIRKLAKVSSIKTGENIARPSHSAIAVVDGNEIFVPLTGIIDFSVEKRRLEKEINRIEDSVIRTEKRLSNGQFLSRAAEDIIQKEKEKLKSFNDTLRKLRESLEILSG